MFLAERGKDKVRIGNRQEVALGLGTLGGSPAPDASVAHGDQRLFHLVAAAFGIGVGVQEAGEPLLLVRLEHFGPHRNHQDQAGDHQDDPLLPLQAAQEEPDNEYRDVGQRGSQVGLFQHQQHRQPDQQKSLEDVAPGQIPAGEAGEVSRHGDNQHHLDPFRRLKVNTTGQLDPAPPTQNLGSKEKYPYQRDQAEAIDPVHRLQQPVVIDQGEEKHRAQPADEPEDLLGFKAHKLGMQGGAIDLQDADHRKQQHHGQEQPV